MRITLFAALLLSLALCRTIAAQPSPYGSLDGNLGTWKWDKPQPKPEEEEEEHEPGETSWERLDAERKADIATPPQQEAPQSLSPLQLWRLLRGKHDSEDSSQ
jgi:hypothetical protein